MYLLLKILLVLNVTLLIVHEMDAIRRKEWKMFIVLKDMKEETAYSIFSLVHIPLFAIILFFLLSPAQQIFLYIMDVLLLAHTLVHFGFRKHKNNDFASPLSQALIYGLGGISLIHLLCMAFYSLLE